MTAGDGTKWVMKSTYFGGQQHAYLYLNEALGGLLGRRLGVPVPEPAVVRLTLDQARLYKPDPTESECIIFGSERIEACEALTPESARDADKREIAGIVVLDALTWNSDEKAEHVLAQQQDAGGWRLWAVDHGHCFVTGNQLGGGPDVDEIAAQPWSLLREQIRSEHLEEFVARSREIAQEDVIEMVGRCPRAWIPEHDAPEKLAEVVVRRAQALERVLYVHFEEAEK